MTKQQPDKLFHDKLASYSRPAPARAWDAIEAGLDKRSRKGLWLKLAASLLLLGTATYILWHVSGSRVEEHGRGLANKQPAGQHTAPATHDTATTPNKTTPIVADAPVIEHAPDAAQTPLATAQPKHTPARQSTQQATVGIAVNTTTAHRTTTKPRAVPEETTPLENNVANNPSPVPASIETSTTDKYTAAAATPVTSSANAVANTTTTTQHDKNITLVYTVREANEYLDKKAVAEATPDDSKPSTLKKLLKKAADLKSNQDPLGELRQRKNEILALNFRSEKQRESKK